MSDRGPNQDFMHLPGRGDNADLTYADASYLGTDEEDDEEVRDLGFIVEDHDDRRITLTGDFQRLDDLDTDEPLETNRSGKIPHEVALQERGVPREWFATDHHVDHEAAERQEEDFVHTSMLSPDPEMNDGSDDFTDETLSDAYGTSATTNILGEVQGVASGMGTSLAQDLGRGGFQIMENPLPDDMAQDTPDADGELSDYDDEESSMVGAVDLLGEARPVEQRREDEV